MKNIIKRSLFGALTLILVIALIFPALNVSAKKNNEGKYEVKVRYGIDGKYRSMKYLPITVDLKTVENDFKGEIEIRVPSSNPGYYDAYSKDVNLAKGESTTAIIPVITNENVNKITVNIIENEKSVFEQKITVSEGRISEGNLFAGIITDDATALGYLGDVIYEDTQNNQNGSLNTVKLDPNSIGDNYLNIDPLDIIFINNYNMGNFTKEHYNSLNAWVNKGGTLIIGAGVNEGKTIKSMDNSLLNVKSKGTSEKSIKIANDNLNLILSDLEIKNSKVKFASEGEPLVYSVENGKGEILVTNFDLGMEPLISSKDASIIWNKLLVSNFEKIRDQYMYGGGYMSYETENLIKSIPVDKVISVWTIGIILGIYALIVGVVVYIVLKKMKKRDLIWVVVPALSVGISLLIYLTGSTTRVKDLVVNQINILDLNEEGRGQVKGRIGVASKYKEDISVEKPKDIVMNFKNENNYYYGMAEEENLNKLRVKTTYKDNNSYFNFEDSNALEMKQFEVYGNEQSLPKIESNFNYDGGKLNGVIKNNLDSNINKLILVSGENVWDLGHVKKGEELKIDKVEIQKAVGVRMYGEELSRLYWESKWNNSKSYTEEDLKNSGRFGRTLMMLCDEVIFNEKSKLIAITDMPIDYKIDFGKKSISKYDTTVVVQDSEIDFKDKEGNTNFPKGYFKGVMESSSPNAHLDEYSGEIYGEGDVIFNFKVDSNVEILNIEASKTESMYGNKEVAEYFVYNYKNSTYEKINLDVSQSVNLPNEEDYSKDNNIKFKVVIGTNGSGRIPKLTIKGKVK